MSSAGSSHSSSYWPASRGGSARRRVTLDRLATIRRRLEDRRTNWVEQTTTDLARTYALIAIEDLRVRNMVRRPVPKPDPAQPGAFLPNGARAKAALNKAILASCWGRFLGRIEHKMPEGHVVRVDPRNTSRTCADCGHCAPGNRESQVVFECEACGHQAHADTQRRSQHPGARHRFGPGARGVRAQKPSGPRWQRQPTGCVAAENPRTSVRENVNCVDSPPVYTKVHLLVSFLVGVAVAVAGLWVWDRVQDVSLNDDPLDYVTIAHKRDPVTGDPDAMLRRLDRVSEASWQPRQLYVGVPRGRESLPQHVERLGELVELPQGEQWRLAATFTNLLDGRSASAHGRLVVVWFQGSNNAQDRLLEDPTVFPDQAVEDARRTWWAGEFVVYYSPEGAATDHTEAIDRWAREITVCPTHANPCETPG